MSLVGAGPGDPELLTLKAYKRLQQADVILYDRLVSTEIRQLIAPQAEQFYVGKARSFHSVPQNEINEALVGWAHKGKRVVRLKGGDPFIFGRGGEELETLLDAAINVEVVPGITAASGCSAYAGIPLTHRDHAQSVRFVTGHLKSADAELDWDSLSRPGQTLVFYMGLGSIDFIRQSLINHGMPEEMPLALIEQGTTRRQRVYIGSLSAPPTALTDGIVQPPTLLIVGSVVSLHGRLDWFSPATGLATGFEPGEASLPLRKPPES
ncbi:uroporphyrinogen-III C-methyltransferase [Halomonas kashgarensis]|uniref:uroporphyrinogen-III C-methyltransferase n=1 Tax=Halomonas kashgarensis TaxID=3084920 RepID=UPI003A90A9D4